MNVIQRICEKYPIEYSLMPDLRMRSVNLSFGAQIPDDLQDKIMDGLDWLGVYVEDMGMPMSLDVSAVREDSYTLSVSGREMFHFTAFTGIAFVGYDIVEAVIWTIYILAGRKNWLEPYQGKYISCRAFSSRQQAAAVKISSSVARQFQSDFSQDQLRAVFERLRARVAPFVSQAPRFSAQPIEESVFEKCKGVSAEATLQEIAARLFGSQSFEQEQKAYCRLVQNSNAYRNQLEEAVQMLVETAYGIPIMAVSNLFIGLGTLINEIEHTDSGECRRLLQERVKFSLSAASLKNCFAEVDNAYRYEIRTELETAFLREACEKANTRINREFTKAKRSIRQLWNALGHFCFIRPDSFADGNGAGTLSWKQLDDLMDRDIFSENVFWTPDSLNDLQSVIQSTYAPQLWLCSEKLRNQSELASITDILITQPVPVMDDRLVWGLWVDV
jgi:hypothetical protein